MGHKATSSFYGGGKPRCMPSVFSVTSGHLARTTDVLPIVWRPQSSSFKSVSFNKVPATDESLFPLSTGFFGHVSLLTQTVQRILSWCEFFETTNEWWSSLFLAKLFLYSHYHSTDFNSYKTQLNQNTRNNCREKGVEHKTPLHVTITSIQNYQLFLMPISVV